MTDGDATLATPSAGELLALWSRLAAQHVALGMSCGCGAGGVAVRLEDFELDIADYLLGESERLGAAAAHAFVDEGVPLAERRQPVRDLLERLEAGGAPAEARDWLLPRLARTLQSFARLHGPTGAQ